MGNLLTKKGTALLSVLLAATVVLTGCGNSSGQSNASSNGSSNASSNGSSNGSSVKSNSQKVTITLLSRWPELRPAFDQTIAGFEKENPDIVVMVQEAAVGQYTTQLQAAIQGNELPDIYAGHPGFSLEQLNSLGVVHNLNSIITPAVQKEFLPGTFTPGYTTLNGNVYVLPMYSGYHYTDILYYNKKVLQQYGISTNSIPTTWNQMQAIGQEIYKKSNGTVYGVVVGAKPAWLTQGIIKTMATAISPDVFWEAGGNSGINFKTGKYQFDTPGIVQTLDYFKTLQKDNVLHPNSLQSTPAQARSLFESGKAAFILDGSYDAGTMVKDGFTDFGVGSLPTKDGLPTYEGFQGQVESSLLVSENTKHFPEVQKFLDYFINNFYKIEAENGFGEPPIPSAMNVKMPFPQFKDVVALQDKTHVLVPNVFARNINTVQAMVDANAEMPSKSVGNILQGYLTGQISNKQQLVASLQDLNKQANKAISDAISASNGKVTASDFMFSNWTPFQPYTQDKYQQLK